MAMDVGLLLVASLCLTCGGAQEAEPAAPVPLVPDTVQAMQASTAGLAAHAVEVDVRIDAKALGAELGADVGPDVGVGAALGPLGVQLGRTDGPETTGPAPPDGEMAAKSGSTQRGPLAEPVAASVQSGLAAALLTAWASLHASALTWSSRALAVAQGLGARFSSVPARWLAGVVFLGGFSRIQGAAALEHPTRQEIARLAEDQPGIHIEEVRRRIQVSTNTAIHHVRVLERNGLVVLHAHGGQRLLYPPTGQVTRSRRALVLLRGTARRIAACIEAEPGVDQTAVCAAVGRSAPAASRHLKLLEQEGLIRVVADGRRRRYHPGASLPALLAMAEAPAARASVDRHVRATAC